ncbi:hypothetical protein Tco_0566094 [Tanacetum coccineum]
MINQKVHSGSNDFHEKISMTPLTWDQFLHDKPIEDDQEKSKVREESDSTIPDPNQQTVTSTPPVIAPFIDVSSTKPSSLVPSPPINTEATNNHYISPRDHSIHRPSAKSGKIGLEQEMSEVKKTDHQADNKNLKRVPNRIIRIKKEQGEEKQDSTYSIRSTDKVDLEEFDLKSALFKHMNKIKSDPNQNNLTIFNDISNADEGNDLERDTDNATFPRCRPLRGKKKLCKADLEGPAFNLVKAFHKNSVFLQYQMDECHKLLTNKVDLYRSRGDIQIQTKCNKNHSDKERRIALSISKLKAARYLDFGFEELVPSLWVESEREYDISADLCILTWWFIGERIHINKHSESSLIREVIRSQMLILIVNSV